MRDGDVNKAVLRDLAAAEIDPVPLPELRPVPRLDVEMLPGPFREWLSDISRRRWCPLEYPALAALCGVGGVVGTKIGIRPKIYDTFFVLPNLFGMAVGESGSLKTDGLRDGLQFPEEIETAAWADFEKRLPEIQAAECDRNAELTALEADLKYSYNGKRRPKSEDRIVDREATKARIAELKAIPFQTPNRLLIEDGTVEKIGELLRVNSRGLVAYHDELSALLDTFKVKDRAGDRSFYLKAWGGTGSHVVDRIGRGSMRIGNLCLTVVGGIQPAKIAPFVDEVLSGRNDDGLLQRFGAMVYPDPLPRYKYVDDPPKGVAEARAVFTKLNAFDPAAYGCKRLSDDAGGYYFLQFNTDAQEFFRTWLTELENNRRGFVGYVSELPGSHISKLRGLMPKLALIFQMIDLVAGIDRDLTVSLKNAKLAADWCEFFKAHAERLYAISASSGFSGARRVLKAISSGDLENRFTPREVQRKCWSGLTDRTSVQEALSTLEEYGWIAKLPVVQTGGRPSVVYVSTNPDTSNSLTKPTKGFVSDAFVSSVSEFQVFENEKTDDDEDL
ncbi:MAG: YfjI family protein [Pyrinomonadaceae bacterium]